MTNFATDHQFSRAGRILRKLMYKNTMKPEKRPENIPYFNYKDGGSQPSIGVEGHKNVYIEVGKYSVRPEDIGALRNIKEIKERDEILFSENGFKLYVNTPEMKEE